MHPIHIAGATVNQTPLDWQGNKQRILAAIKEAQAKQITFVCFPELCITGYGCEDLFLSDWLWEKAFTTLLEIVPHIQGISVALGLPIRYKGISYNTVAVVSNGKILGFTAKQFMALDGVHYEPRWFTPWPGGKIEEWHIHGQTYLLGDVTYEINGLHIAFEICEDAWHTNERPGIRHCEKLDKLHLLCNPSASHFAFHKTWEREREVVLGGSKRFQCMYIYANLLGNEAGRMIYDGDIQIAQNGRMLNKNGLLSFQDYQITSALVHPEDASQSITTWYEEISSKEEELAAANTLALFDYLRKSRSKGFVLSLSGGADSSSIAVMVAEMVRRGIEQLGVERFLQKLHRPELLPLVQGLSAEERRQKIMSYLLSCAYQGTSNSSDDTFQSAKKLAESIGATFHHWSVEEEVKSYTQKIEKALQKQLTWENDDLTLQNIQARSRAPIIWMLANHNQALLLTTSNRSEGDVGYATMDGDTAGSIAPIAAVDKYFILQWIRWAEKSLGYTGLAAVNSLQPSAELRPLERVQTDEKDLMPYAIIVEIEKLAIRDRLSPVACYQTLQAKALEPDALLVEHIVKFYRLWARNQWKRERLAPAFHLDDFNVDPRTWCRFPILSHGFEEEIQELLAYAKQ
ncbi:NAD(+) synthase [Cytophagales bacterium LB-30]|uniref:Glutamine-dependent NAD(+) synthetase n=1 Tax=Shiella aurantiaca TaxID=3058365 RepID=A0ABT8F361_9BACT|nr:NAD(+) synthase [Shiella aurantiaca]MDN4164896.1 NAD(+) synthase [Shiella aurantiaca]